MTPDQLETIERMRTAGRSYQAIGNRIGMSPGCVSWYCLRHAIEPPNPRKPVEEIRGPLVMKRGGHEIRRFTADEDRLLQEWEKEGLSTHEIARRLGRRWNSTRGRSMILARRAERLGL